ncbi:MAG: hypothetical protein KDK30_08075 [Leptospiraceae bacterium]|nr:hypothetical protein [Leptospiraceae bacterium]MCB1316344.1 hypothetical protein [Leptospiraceae bacterium]MCB1318634.1 hypothetical protein [Leptospiraceae bacterium]
MSAMADYTRRLHVLLSDEQFDFLNDLAQRHRRSVGELVREAIDHTYRPVTDTAPLLAVQTLRDHPRCRLSYNQIMIGDGKY